MENDSQKNQLNKVSCIIPAYNESERISEVLDVVSGHPLINEVIVVDDCSTDKTVQKVSEFQRNFPNIILYRNEKNMGKSCAVYNGIKQSTGDILFFIDADLKGLTAQDLTDLVKPVLENNNLISISMRKNSPGIDRLIGLDYLSGERVFAKSMISEKLEQIPKILGFELEVFLNAIIIENKIPIKIIFWKNVESPFKFKKFFGLNIRSDVYMFFEILKFISPITIISQFIQMKRLMLK